jgi:hypothetical protein
MQKNTKRKWSYHKFMPRRRFEHTTPVLEEKIQSLPKVHRYQMKCDIIWLNWKQVLSLTFQFHRLYECVIHATLMKIWEGDVITFRMLPFWLLRNDGGTLAKFCTEFTPLAFIPYSYSLIEYNVWQQYGGQPNANF